MRRELDGLGAVPGGSAAQVAVPVVQSSAKLNVAVFLGLIPPDATDDSRSQMAIVVGEVQLLPLIFLNTMNPTMDDVANVGGWRLKHSLPGYPDDNGALIHDLIHISLQKYLGKTSEKFSLLEGCRYGCPSIFEEILVSLVQRFLKSGDSELALKRTLESCYFE